MQPLIIGNFVFTDKPFRFLDVNENIVLSVSKLTDLFVEPPAFFAQKIDGLNHALIFGEEGSGKTALRKQMSFFAAKDGYLTVELNFPREIKPAGAINHRYDLSSLLEHLLTAGLKAFLERCDEEIEGHSRVAYDFLDYVNRVDLVNLFKQHHSFILHELLIAKAKLKFKFGEFEKRLKDNTLIA
jgi:hypothetical protein